MQTEIYKLMAEVEDNHWWFIGRGAILDKAISLHIDKSKKNDILDLGCGSGGNFRILKDYGTITGLEPEDIAVDIARKRNIADKVIQGTIEETPEIKQKQYDLIVMTDVLEHIKDDREALKHIHSMLKDDGKYIMTVPAMMFLWGSHDTAHYHHRRYTVRELKQKFDEAGFKIHYISYFNFWLFLPIAFVRILQRVFKLYSNKTTLKHPNPIINGILKTIFTSEKMFVGKVSLPFGVSAVAVVSKK